jgi:hypothetical protein
MDNGGNSTSGGTEIGLAEVVRRSGFLWPLIYVRGISSPQVQAALPMHTFFTAAEADRLVLPASSRTPWTSPPSRLGPGIPL